MDRFLTPRTTNSLRRRPISANRKGSAPYRNAPTSERLQDRRQLPVRGPRDYAIPPESLHRTWSFRLAMLAFVCLSTKSIAGAMHGLAGMSVILALAAVAAVCSDSFSNLLLNVRRNGERNLLLLVLASWYLVGAFGKMYLSAEPDTDWRRVTAPVEIILGLLMAFAFLHEDRCARIFQIAYIMMVGVQSVFTGSVVVDDPSIVREAVAGTQGGWIYGDQGGFAMNAMLLPLLVWRGFFEKGILRLLLLACCTAIAFTVAVSQFGTAVGLFLLSFPTAVLFSVFFVKQQKHVLHVLSLVFFVSMGAFAFSQMLQNPLMQEAKFRILNVWQDPTSGGYAGQYAESESRWYKAEISLNSFLEHPFFGGGQGRRDLSSSIGGHSAFFDMLGFFGLLGGGGAFIYMLLLMLMRAWRRLRRHEDWEGVAATTSVVLLLIGGVVNPYWEGEPTLMVLLLARLVRLPQEPA